MLNNAAYITDMLDMDKPAEKEARDIVLGLVRGFRPTWHMLGVRRDGDKLLLAVSWERSLKPAYAVVELKLGAELVMRIKPAPSVEAARAALDQQGGAS